MTHAHPPRAVLGSDILYSRVLHELSGRLGAQRRLLDVCWSEQLLDETQQSLIGKKHLSTEAARRWVDYLRQSSPNGRVDLEHADLPDLTALTRDPGDHHISAPATASEAQYLFTHDRGYLQDGLSGPASRSKPPTHSPPTHWTPTPDGILARLQLQAATWAGGRPLQDLIDAIDRAGAPTFAANARTRLSL